MMTPSVYQKDSRKQIHRGAIYQYRPVFWLEPPLYILRDIRWKSPGYADLYLRNELQDDFKVLKWNQEENVVARAKVRPVIILSNDHEASDPRVKQVVVAPVYTLKSKWAQEKLDRFRRNYFPHSFYLPHDRRFSELRESYVGYRSIRSLDKRFLIEGKKYGFSLTQLAMKALLMRYLRFLSVVG